MLPAFSHMTRHWDPENERWAVKILPGEYYVTKGDEAVSTVLGSCISACIRDPRMNVGGMNHFMLPDDGADLGQAFSHRRRAREARASLNGVEHG